MYCPCSVPRSVSVATLPCTIVQVVPSELPLLLGSHAVPGGCWLAMKDAPPNFASLLCHRAEDPHVMADVAHPLGHLLRVAPVAGAALGHLLRDEPLRGSVETAAEGHVAGDLDLVGELGDARHRGETARASGVVQWP